MLQYLLNKLYNSHINHFKEEKKVPFLIQSVLSNFNMFY